MPHFKVSAALIERHYRMLDKFGGAGLTREAGYTRTPYSPEETSAMQYIASEAKRGGLDVRHDDIGNLIVETPGDYKEYIETGSHLDTVPFGGNYDGMAGVIGGLEAIAAIFHSTSILKRGLRLRAWRGEESAAFGHASMGSRAAFGKLSPKVLDASYQGKPLAQWIEESGIDPSCIQKKIPALSQEEINSIFAYVELHIEQGDVLEAERKDIGIVSGIRGSARYHVTLKGQFDHSGTTPMGTEFRRDVNLAIGHIILALDELGRKSLSESMDLVQTIGVINSNREMNEKHEEVYTNAMSKVSGFGYFSFEVRSCNNDMQRYCKIAQQLIQEKAKKLGVECHIEELSFTPGIDALSLPIRKTVQAVCNDTGAVSLDMVSGAWHDVAVVAEQRRGNGSHIPSGLIFIPSHNGTSHSPAEYTSPEQIAIGATVLSKTMFKLANESKMKKRH